MGPEQTRYILRRNRPQSTILTGRLTKLGPTIASPARLRAPAFLRTAQ